MMYCIMRVEKRKRTDVYGLQIEANRTIADAGKRDFADSDIDWSRTADNVFLRKTDNWNAEITRRIKEAELNETRRSIVLLDGLYTASPEYFQNKSRDEIIQYFQECLAYHDATFGVAINAVIHFDEKTPHMQVASIPIYIDDSGKRHLSAKDIMGNRDVYRKRQDMFWEQVGRPRGLERGELHDAESRRRHLTKRQHQLHVAEQNAYQAQYTANAARDLAKSINAQLADNRERLKIYDDALKSTVSIPKPKAHRRIFSIDDVILSNRDYEELVKWSKVGHSINDRVGELARKSEEVHKGQERLDQLRDQVRKRAEREAWEQVYNSLRTREEQVKQMEWYCYLGQYIVKYAMLAKETIKEIRDKFEERHKTKGKAKDDIQIGDE